MKTKHTSGEWNIKLGGNFSGTFVNYVISGKINIAQTRGNDNEMTFEENLANAKLIAAAPEMLKTLIEVRKHGLIEKDGYEIIVKEVNQAIKKATE